MVQVGHVCREAGAASGAAACHLVLLQVADREALCRALAYCRERGIRFQTFTEPDPVASGEEPMGLTAACTEPLEPAQRKWLRRFRLWEE